MEYTPMKLLVYAVVAVALIYILVNFFLPYLIPKENALAAIGNGLVAAQASAGKVLGGKQILFPPDMGIMGESFDSGNRYVTFACTNPEYCCSLEQTGLHRCKVLFDARSAQFTAFVEPETYFRCGHEANLFTCRVYFGRKPAQLEVVDVEFKGSFDLSTEDVKVKLKVKNTGELAAFDVLTTANVYSIGEDEMGMEVESLYRGPYTEYTEKIGAGDEEEIEFALDVLDSGNYVLRLHSEAFDAGFDDNEMEFSTEAALITKTCAVVGEGGTKLRDGRCITEYLCQDCNFAYECVLRWDEAGVDGLELADPGLAYFADEEGKCVAPIEEYDCTQIAGLTAGLSINGTPLSELVAAKIENLSGGFQTILEREQKYDGLINVASEGRGLDPTLVKALIATESAYKETALSSAGATGLMQIMPKYHRCTSGDTVQEYDTDGDGCLTMEQMNMPEINLKLGTEILARYLDKPQVVGCEARIPLALAAYNGGPSRVVDCGIDGAPQETRNYPVIVLAYYALFCGTPAPLTEAEAGCYTAKKENAGGGKIKANCHGCTSANACKIAWVQKEPGKYEAATKDYAYELESAPVGEGDCYWGPPVDPKYVGWISEFNHPYVEGYKPDRFGHRWKSVHRGSDLMVKRNGIPVMAVADGEVLRVSSSFVYVKHVAPDGTIYSGCYGHVKGKKSLVGKQVKRGDVIATIYYPKDPHLHFEVYKGKVVKDAAPSSKHGKAGTKFLANDEFLIDPERMVGIHYPKSDGGCDVASVGGGGDGAAGAGNGISLQKFPDAVNRNTVEVITLDPGQYEVKVHSAQTVAGKSTMQMEDLFEAKNPIAAINGGIYGSYGPAGHLVENGIFIKGEDKKFANAYFLWENGVPKIVKKSDFEFRPSIESAVANTLMLYENEIIESRPGEHTSNPDRLECPSGNYNYYCITATARTGVCVTADGTVKLMTVGTKTGDARSVTIHEFAEFARDELGCRYAINLDGGGSTSMKYAGPGGEFEKYAESPSSGGRAVNNFVAVYPKAGSVPSGTPPAPATTEEPPPVATAPGGICSEASAIPVGSDNVKDELVVIKGPAGCGKPGGTKDPGCQKMYYCVDGEVRDMDFKKSNGEAWGIVSTGLKVGDIKKKQGDKKTPVGTFKILGKRKPHKSYDPEGFIHLDTKATVGYDGGIGVHDIRSTKWLGMRRSAGCIRTYASDQRKLWGVLQVGDPVTVRARLS